MIKNISRRLGLKFLGLGTLSTFYRPAEGLAQGPQSDIKTTRLDAWGKSHDRVFLGATSGPIRWRIGW